MTVSTVMQLQKHQPGSRRFAILVGDSQGQQHIAVMTGQMLAGEVGLQLRIIYGGKQLGHRVPKPSVRQKGNPPPEKQSPGCVPFANRRR